MYVVQVLIFVFVILSGMKLSEELKWRGFINQTTYTDLSELDNEKLTFYHGFDASADSQTVGNLAAMMLDKVFMRHGHKAIILAGGATSLIGDPGGKDIERPLQDEKTVAYNVAKAEEQLKKIFAGQLFTLVNNLDWTKRLTVIEYLRDYGKHFSMTPLVQRDYIAKRMFKGGGGISYAEFSYTVLQGMDFLHLYDKYGVSLQLGGSDQWGNCLSGVELIRKTRGKEVHVITLPLIINKATGKKFGKSEEGAIWLDPKKTPINQFYQFWVNTSDQDVEDYLKVFTELNKEEITASMKKHAENRKLRHAQFVLAGAVTTLVHGSTAAANAMSNAKNLKNDDLSKQGSESIKISEGYGIAETLVQTGLADSKTEARRLLESGGVYVNGKPTTKNSFQPDDFNKAGLLKLRRGKSLRNTVIIKRR